MRYSFSPSVLTFAALLAVPGWAFAQGTTTNGMFGNRTTGSGISAGSGSAFGSSSPLSNLGQSTPTLSNSVGVGGQARQAGSFVGANTGQTAGQNFVGAAQLNSGGQSGYGGSGGMGSYGSSGMGGMGGYGGMGGMGGMGGGYGQRMGQGAYGIGFSNNSASSTLNIRTVLKMDHEDMPVVVSAKVGEQITSHLRALPALHQAQVQLVQEQTAAGSKWVLRGAVASKHDRDLAERVVLLEPTVDEVDNQIVYPH